MIGLTYYPVKFIRYTFFLLILLSVLQLIHFYIFDIALIRAEVHRGQWWRLLSGQWVHSNAYHFFSNSLVLICLNYLDRRVVVRKATDLLCLSGLTGGAVYFFCPALDYYVGLSGILHGYLLLILMSMWREGPLLAGVGIMLLLTKLVLEQVDWYPRVATEELIGMRVAIEAHLVGAVAAVIIVSLEFIYRLYKRK